METSHCHSMLCSHDTGCASFYQARVESNTSSENHKTCFTQKHFSSCDLRFSFLLFTEINLAFALSRRRSSFPPLVDKPFSTTETLCMLVFVDCGELFADDASRHRSICTPLPVLNELRPCLADRPFRIHRFGWGFLRSFQS